MTTRNPGAGRGPRRSLSVEAIDGFLAWHIVRAGRAVERALTATFADQDLTPTQFGVLALLATGEDLTQSDLARAVLVRPQSVGPLVASLVDRGLIRRRGPGGRGRRAYFDLTAAGRRLIERAWPDVTELHAPPSLGLDAREARALAAALTVVERAVGRADEPT